ncbi:hypothetical protein KHQ88_04290 [Mycoplasmatota bacterium]|nr:hypothetical protein KHQ88_04290 [Mycoplasmatota bacterium]
MKDLKKVLLVLLMSFLSLSVFACSEGTDIEETKTELAIELSTVDTHRKNTIYIDGGQVYTKGDNRVGELGDGTFESKDVEVNITSQFDLDSDDEIVSVRLGEYHGIALSQNGRVFTWGHNSYGKLGLAGGSNQNTPVDITDNFNLEENEKIVYISAGRDNNAIITSMNRVFTFGVNAYGQLGNGEINNPWEETIYTPQDITDAFELEDDYIVKIDLGNNHSMALSAYGQVFAWGDNEYGQLGIGDEDEQVLEPMNITDQFDLDEDQIIDIEVGYNHSGVLSETGRVFVFGDNSLGQLGIGTLPRLSYEPIEISDSFSEDEDIVRLRFSHESSAVITNQNAYVFGYNFNGQLGLGHQSAVNTPTIVDKSLYNNQTIIDIFIAKETYTMVFDDQSIESQDLT